MIGPTYVESQTKLPEMPIQKVAEQELRKLL